MAPIPSPAVAAAAVLAKRMSSGTKTALAHAGSGGTYGGIGVGVVLFIAFVIFAIMYYVLYKDAKKKFEKTGKPINHAKIFGMAALCAVGVGLIMWCLSGGGDGNDNGGNGGGGGGGGGGDAGLAAGGVAVPPMTYQNPFAGPVHTAAVDPIQV